MQSQDLEKYLLEHIPISAAMGVRVETSTAAKTVLSAPFSNNINHKKTVFGGSLHAVATLACWSFLHVNLIELIDDSMQIVIASSEIQYIAPVSTDFKAECHQPAAEEWERFLTILRKKGLSLIHI